MHSESTVKTRSNSLAVSMKRSKFGGSSLFQNTVGMPCARHQATRSRTGCLGAPAALIIVAQRPLLPCQADSQNSMAGRSRSSTSRQSSGPNWICCHSYLNAIELKTSRITATLVSRACGPSGTTTSGIGIAE